MDTKPKPENPVKKAIRLLNAMSTEMDMLKELEERKAAEIDNAIPAEVKVAIAQIEAAYAEPIAHEKQVFASAEGQARAYFLELGVKRIVGEKLMAIRSDGKPTWNTEKLKQFFDKLPTLLPEFYQEGKPFVTIRKK